MAGIPARGGRSHTQRCPHGRRQVKVEVDTGVMREGTSEGHQGLPATPGARGGEEAVFLRAFSGSVALRTAQFQISGPQNCEGAQLLLF